MTELTDFLQARLAEDADAARAAFYEGQRWVPEEEAVVAGDRDLDPVLYLDRKRDAEHAANWSPARVLVEVEAKRAIVAECYVADCIEDDLGTVMERARATPYVGERILRLLAAPYRDHPGYQEGWAL